MTMSAESVGKVASQLEAHVHHRSEAGLFIGNDDANVAGLAGEIKKARDLIADDDLAAASEVLLGAYAVLHVAIAGKSLFWRAVHIHALDIYIYLIAWAAALVLAGKACDDAEYSVLWGVPLSVLVFGALGGVLRGLWWITKKVEARILRTQFRPQYYAAPVIAGILGIVAFVLADFLASGLPTAEADGGDGDPRILIGVNGLAFIAGFYWEWIIEKIKAATN